MRLRGPAAVLALAALAACGGARAARRPPSPAASVVITNVSVIDVAAGTARSGMTVVTSGARIATVTPGGRPLAGATHVDGTGRFLIPGLWDMHTHHQAAGAGALPLYVANGVVGTRDMGSDLEFILALRARVEAGELGPAIVAAGPMLDDAPADWPWRRRVADGAQAAVAAGALFDAGVDFLKVHDHTPREAYLAIAEEAKRRGRVFAGHVPSSVTVEEAAAAGQASIEHLANFRVFLECSGERVVCRRALRAAVRRSGGEERLADAHPRLPGDGAGDVFGRGPAGRGVREPGAAAGLAAQPGGLAAR